MRIMSFLLAFGIAPLSLVGDTAKFVAFVVDDDTGNPIWGATVRANFSEEIGMRAWTAAPCPDVAVRQSGQDGRCRLQGKTNCGRVCCWVVEPPDGYYAGRGWGHTYSGKNLLGVWQPDNLVATIRLQRVERPIPLMVKSVEWRNRESGLHGLQGTNAVMRFDMMRGDWLPPYGHGERSDLEIASEIRITGKERRYRHSTRSMGDVVFYDLVQTVCPADAADCLSESHPSPSSGIMIRTGNDSGVGGRAVRLIGKRKRIERTGNWECEYTKDYDPDRCYTFRIRTRRDGDGNLVEAYHGKIYGDFMFSGDLERGVTEIRFLYYLNPTPLDRNLEWDMRNNLCPDPGSLGERRP